MKRLFDRLALDNTRRGGFQQTVLGSQDRPFIVQRLAEGIDYPADQAFADGNLDDLARALDRVAFADACFGAKQDRADIVFL